MRFAFDEDVSHPLARRLRSHRYDIESAKELARLRLRDPQVLTSATEAGQVLVTHNGKDFASLHEAWTIWRRRWERQLAQAGLNFTLSSHTGIIVLPHLPDTALAQLLEAFADSYANIDDRLFVWSVSRGWYEVTF